MTKRVSVTYTRDMAKTALEKALEIVGGTVALAKQLEIEPQAISQWEIVPPARVLAVEEATNKQVTRYELRPDIFGKTPKLGVA